jgi:serine/threonine-protein kinase
LTLVHSVQADQEHRWAAGERPLVEDYLVQRPELRDNAGAVVALLLSELFLRQRAGEQPRLEDMAARFPHLAEPLALLLSLHATWSGAFSGEVVSANPQGPGVPPLLSPEITTDFQPTPPHPKSRAPVTMAANGPALPAVPGYTILSVLGRGGMGVVYRAQQQGLQRIVALKMILHGEHVGDEKRRRFQAEAEAIAQLGHPHIVQVYEVGEHNGLPYFSMELCGGGGLEKQLDGTPWEARRAAALVQALAEAVDAAHRRGLIHRDLKPANVLLTEEGVPKVTDFGLVKRLDAAGPTQTGAVVGTPSYMAPEQAAGRTREIGPATDVYALGAILYELLTGRPPFRGATSVDTMRQVVAVGPVPVRRMQPKVPRDLETVCHKCLEKQPGKRYSSAAALAEDLRRFLAGEPVLARPVGAFGRLAKWARRRPTVAALVAAVAEVTGLGLAGMLLAYGEAVQQREEAVKAREAVEKEADKVRQEKQRADANASEAKIAAEQAEQSAAKADAAARRADAKAAEAEREKETAVWQRYVANLGRAEAQLAGGEHSAALQALRAMGPTSPAPPRTSPSRCGTSGASPRLPPSAGTAAM